MSHIKPRRYRHDGAVYCQCTAASTYLYGLAEQALKRRGEPGAGESAVAVAPDAVTEHSATEFTARVTVSGRKASFTVELLLPSRRAAEVFADSLSQPDESAAVAHKLARKLRRRDPIAGRVALSKLQYAGALIGGVLRGLRR